MSAELHLRLRRGRAAMDAPRPRVPAVHAFHCRCARCDPARAGAALRALNHWARLTLAGLALGLAFAWIVDRAVGGPGILSIFGA